VETGSIRTASTGRQSGLLGLRSVPEGPSALRTPSRQLLRYESVGHDAPLPGALWQVPARRTKRRVGALGPVLVSEQMLA